MSARPVLRFNESSSRIDGPALTAAFFARPVVEVARDLVGALLLVDGVGGRIVETEAYARDDPASHSFRGPTARNAAMFGPPGRAYVYRSYGMHWCFNATCGEGSAVLLRALEPLAGLDAMRARRGLEADRLLCSGPGRLCAALGLTNARDGAALDAAPFRLVARTGAVEVAVGPRVGITKAAAVPWRFGLAGSRYLSRPFPKAVAGTPPDADDLNDR